MTGEMTQQLSTLGALPEDISSIPNKPHGGSRPSKIKDPMWSLACKHTGREITHINKINK